MNDLHHYALIDTLSLVSPHLPEELVSSKVRENLFVLAGKLPPFARVLLECRLDGVGQVDLSFCLLDADFDKTLLPLYLEKLADDSNAWQKTLKLMSAWCSKDENQENPDSLWFEFDIEETTLSPPALFFPLGEGSHGQNYERSRGALAHLSEDAVKLLDLWSPRIPADGVLTFAGYMLSRPGGGLRLNIGRLSADSAWAWLQEYGVVDGSGESVFKSIFDLSDKPVLTVDVTAARIGERFGLECQPDSDASSDKILEILTERGLCGVEQYEALANWPGLITPLDDNVDWPLHLVHEALAEPSIGPSVLVRRLNHVKMVFLRDKLVQAKAYLAFTHALMPSLDDLVTGNT